MNHHLSSQDKQNIVELIIESNGCRLSKDQVSELIASTLENVAGFETASTQVLCKSITEIRKLYYESIN